jgi:hypothetical protein
MVVLAAVSGLAGAGCMEPLQSGGVMIVGDPSERIAAMCRFRHEGKVAACFEVGEEEGEAAAESVGTEER